MPCLKAYLLGGVRFEIDERKLTQFRSKYVATLLAYLLLNRKRVHSRVELATIFFPEQSEDRARTYLRAALYQLKKLLRSAGRERNNFLLTTPQTISFNEESDFWVDVTHFEDLLRQASESPPDQAYPLYLEAIELYRGDLLAGFYEDWILVEQERLRSEFLDVLSMAARYEESKNLYREAISHLRQSLLLRPLNEETHRNLIRLLIAQGDVESAQKQYRLCQRLLDLELAVDLDPATQALGAELEMAQSPQKDHREFALAELERGKAALAHGYREPADRLLQRARRHLVEIHDSAESEAILELGRLALKAGETDLAKQRFMRVLDLARLNQDTALEALALNGLGAVVSAAGQLKKAKEYYDLALKLAEQGHHSDIRWRVLNNLGRNHWLQDRYDEALKCYTMVQLLCEQLTLDRGLSIVLQNQGTLYSHIGLFEEAHSCYKEALHLAIKAEDPSRLRSIWINWADVYERQGQPKEAEENYRAGYRICWEIKDEIGCALSLCGLGQSCHMQGDLKRAERYLNRALISIARKGTPPMEVQIHSTLAQLLNAQGSLQDAFAHSSAAIDLLKRGAAYDEPERVQLTHSEILYDLGEKAASREFLINAWQLINGRSGQFKREDHRRAFFNIPLNQLIRTRMRNCKCQSKFLVEAQ